MHSPKYNRGLSELTGPTRSGSFRRGGFSKEAREFSRQVQFDLNFKDDARRTSFDHISYTSNDCLPSSHKSDFFLYVTNAQIASVKRGTRDETHLRHDIVRREEIARKEYIDIANIICTPRVATNLLSHAIY